MTRAVLGRLIRQGEAKEVIKNLEAVPGCPSTKKKIRAFLEPDNAVQIYEKFYFEVLYLLTAKEDDTQEIIKKSKIYLTSSEIDQKIKEPIIALLHDSFQTEVNQEITKNSDFLKKEIPIYLEGKDTQLLFETLWGMLREIGFSEAQICSAWGVALCHVLDHKK